MADSNSFSSLLDLVEHHLSSTTVQESLSEGPNKGRLGHSFQMPTLNVYTQSDTNLGHRFPPESPIKNVLAKQVSNMLKAKEKKELQERERLRLESENSDQANEEEDCVINLMQALRIPTSMASEPLLTQTSLSRSNSLESLFKKKFFEMNDVPDEVDVAMNQPILLPCTTDISYILSEKECKGMKCSNFGKVLITRYKNVGMPYFREKFTNSIVRFDFKSKSPCDINIEKSRKPTFHT